MIPTLDQIQAADYAALAEWYWQGTPATTADERNRIRAMADRMAALQPYKAPVNAIPAAPPANPQPVFKRKPKPAAKPAAAADLGHFRSLFRS